MKSGFARPKGPALNTLTFCQQGLTMKIKRMARSKTLKGMCDQRLTAACWPIWSLGLFEHNLKVILQQAHCSVGCAAYSLRHRQIGTIYVSRPIYSWHFGLKIYIYINFTYLSKLNNKSFSNSLSKSAPTILWQFLNNLVTF